jgi:hypothetical protein
MSTDDQGQLPHEIKVADDRRVPADSTAPTGPARFSLGSLVATPAALRAMLMSGVDPQTLLLRHVSGDWGDLGEDDRKANDAAVLDGTRILSAYALGAGRKVWLITEADRSASTFLLPSEY